jgi:hypothetical protein
MRVGFLKGWSGQVQGSSPYGLCLNISMFITFTSILSRAVNELSSSELGLAQIRFMKIWARAKMSSWNIMCWKTHLKLSLSYFWARSREPKSWAKSLKRYELKDLIQPQFVTFWASLRAGSQANTCIVSVWHSG